MNRRIVRRVGFALATLVVALSIPTFIVAQANYPPIPHALEGRDDCLACHETGSGGATQIPDNHTGIKNEIWLYPNQIAKWYSFLILTWNTTIPK